ncbi:hypothetical protein [Terracoccus sp. 273MFTsu3.1]|uniref:channel accessory protein ArfC n=1 Tax=Terracoccus sp. 273MFTsu3.1 TaxID=1172188 RepID=UPI00039BAEC7|nr:hypothetical protein [Terracoccus sp. 273MFTsu3.1]
MKWLLLVLAFVLGAAFTWFLTVRRVSRTVQAGAGPVTGTDVGAAPERTGLDGVHAETGGEPAGPELTPVVSPGEPVAGAVGIAGGADLAAAAGAGVLATEHDESVEATHDVGEHVEPEGTARGVQDEAGEDEMVDEAEVVDEAGFGGAHTPISESPGAAEAWDRNAEDEDALLPRSAAQAAVAAPVRETTPDDDVAPHTPPVADATPNDDVAAGVAPVDGATPNGDLAGVGEPEAVAALDEAAGRDVSGSWADEVPEVDPSSADDLDAAASERPAVDVAPVADTTPSGDLAGVAGPGARPTQGELTFDEPDDSVPPEEKP